MQVDAKAPTGFRGLPPGWDELLKEAKITKEEAIKDGDAILDVLRFQVEQECVPKLPTQKVRSAVPVRNFAVIEDGNAVLDILGFCMERFMEMPSWIFWDFI